MCTRLAVDPVIRRHNRPYPALLDAGTKRRQIYFLHCTLGDHFINRLAVRFLIICCKMLNIRADTLFLYAKRIFRRQTADKHRIFGIAFKSAAAARVALDIDAGRSKQHIDSKRRRFLAYLACAGADDFRIPRRCEQGVDWETAW